MREQELIKLVLHFVSRRAGGYAFNQTRIRAIQENALDQELRQQLILRLHLVPILPKVRLSGCESTARVTSGLARVLAMQN